MVVNRGCSYAVLHRKALSRAHCVTITRWHTHCYDGKKMLTVSCYMMLSEIHYPSLETSYFNVYNTVEAYYCYWPTSFWVILACNYKNSDTSFIVLLLIIKTLKISWLYFVKLIPHLKQEELYTPISANTMRNQRSLYPVTVLFITNQLLAVVMIFSQRCPTFVALGRRPFPEHQWITINEYINTGPQKIPAV